MKILVFGIRGQLGKEIEIRAQAQGMEVIGTDMPELDITNPLPVSELVRSVKPEVIINCAAYTNVDKAQTERELAFAVNCHGAAHIAWAARSVQAHLIHISTDYVFDGSRPSANLKSQEPGVIPLSEEVLPDNELSKELLTEDSPTNPINVYGESKLAGEKEVLHILPEQCLVVRTASVHGQFGINFVHTMLRLLAEKPEVKVVSDQYMSPTWAGWLAQTLLELAKKKPIGLLHAASGGIVSWYEFASEIYRLAQLSVSRGQLCPLYQPAMGHICNLLPTTSADFVRPAPRPSWSPLDCTRLTNLSGALPLSWQRGVIGHLLDLGLCVE